MEKAFFLHRWPKIRKGTLALVDAFGDQDLAFVPVEGGWTLGQIIVHISSAADYWLHSGVLSPVAVYAKATENMEDYPTLGAIKAYLSDEHARTLALLESFDPSNWTKKFPYPDGYSYPANWIFWHVLEHEIHHRGELSLILGILGHEGLDV